MATILVDANNNPNAVTDLRTAVNDNTFDEVQLKGTFNFIGEESGGGTTHKRVITVARSVKICVKPGDSVTIVGGERPFLVDQAGIVVSFEGLKFQNSQGSAIWSLAAADLTVSGCTIKGVFTAPDPGSGLILAFGIFALGITNSLSVLNNEIDVDFGINVTSNDITAGINVIGPVPSVQITGNKIMNITAHGIIVRNTTTNPHSVSLTNNRITTGHVGREGSQGNFANALRCTGKGKYIINDNTFDCGFENGAGVRIGGTKDAEVTQNRILMSPQTNAVLGAESVGIQVRGSCEDTNVTDNEISGRARVALSAVPSAFSNDGPPGAPSRTKFERNNHVQFRADFVDIEVGISASFTDIWPFEPPPVEVEKGLDWIGAGAGTGVVAAAAKTSAVSSESDFRLPDPPQSLGSIADFGTNTTVHGDYYTILLTLT